LVLPHHLEAPGWRKHWKAETNSHKDQCPILKLTHGIANRMKPGQPMDAATALSSLITGHL